MNVRPYRHILINNDTSATKTLEVSPIEWADLTINHLRHELYNTVLFEEALNQRFPKVGSEAEDKGGFWFLKNAYESKGVKADVTYKRQVLNTNTNAYDEDFIGNVDFSADSGWSIEDNKVGQWVDVKIIDSRKLAKFLSRDEIDVDLFGLVSLDGITVPDFTNPYTEATYKKVDIPLQCESDGAFSGLTPVSAVYSGGTTINEIGDRVLIDSPTVDNKIYENILDQESTFIDISAEGTFLIQYSATGVTWDFQVNMRFAVYDESDVFIGSDTIQIATLSGSGTESGFYSGSYSVELAALSNNIPVNGYVQYSLTDTDSGTVTLGETTVNVASLIFFEETEGWPDNQIRGLYAHEVASRFMQLYTSETDTLKLIDAPILGKADSEFITYPSTGYFGRTHTTNAYQLRQFVDRALNLNFRNWFKSLNAEKPIGVWYNKDSDYFEIGELEDFYKAEVSPVSLGEVTNLKTLPYTELYFNNILAGEPRIEIEDFQGVNEVHTEVEYTISIETKNKYDARSPYSRSTIMAETLRRRNKSRFASLDTKNDDKIMLAVLNSSDETVQGDLSDLTGIPNVDQYYNLRATPRQNMIRQQELINAPLFKEVSEEFKFTKSAKDTNISYIDPTTGTTVNELDDIPQLLTELIYPEVKEFTAPYTPEIRAAILQDPHVAFAFENKDGETEYGYILSIEGKPYRQEGEFRLVRANENRLP